MQEVILRAMARQAEVVGGRGGRMLPFVEQNPFGILFRPLHDGVGVTFIRTVMSSYGVST